MYCAYAIALPVATKRAFLLLLSLILLLGVKSQGQTPGKQWDRTLGGAGDDRACCVQQTADGGYIVGGTSTSGISGDKTQPSYNSITTDYWVVKLDSTGAPQWDRTFGGNGGEDLRSAIQTADGGYLLGGTSSSGVSGDKSQPSRGLEDYWIIKLDARGNKVWDRTFGGLNGDRFTSLQQTTDGGYVLGGYSYSGISGDKSQSNRGPQYSSDYWVIKIDALGVSQWDRTVGGDASDELLRVRQTADGGYILGGASWSDTSGDKAQDRQGRAVTDYWIVKLGVTGLPQWNRDYGTVRDDLLADVLPTADGGYLLGGITYGALVSGDKSEPGKGGLDAWLVKLAADGTKQWDRTIGGSSDEGAGSLCQTADGGYVFASYSFSDISGDRTQPRRGSEDYWLVKLGATGAKLWDQAAGSSLRNELSGMRPTTRNGFVLCGYSTGGVSLDKTQPSRGGNDFWVVKLGPPVPAVAAITGDSVLCTGGIARLIVAPPALTYAWSTGATTAGITVTQPGLYSVIATYANGATSTARFQVHLLPSVPPFSLGADTVLCEGGTFVLRSPLPAVPGLRYTWSDGSSAPIVTVREPGLYSLRITGCDTRTASRYIATHPCLLIPNIITPNRDRLNDRFSIGGLTGVWTLQVYNRWGRQVFSTDAYRNDWGNEASSGVYYYLLRQPTTAATYKGWLEVNR